MPKQIREPPFISPLEKLHDERNLHRHYCFDQILKENIRGYRVKSRQDEEKWEQN
jgi:hypothetical protein